MARARALRSGDWTFPRAHFGLCIPKADAMRELLHFASTQAASSSSSSSLYPMRLHFFQLACYVPQLLPPNALPDLHPFCAIRPSPLTYRDYLCLLVAFLSQRTLGSHGRRLQGSILAGSYKPLSRPQGSLPASPQIG